MAHISSRSTTAYAQPARSVSPWTTTEARPFSTMTISTPWSDEVADVEILR